MADPVDGYLWAEILRLALTAGTGRVEHVGILAAGCRAALVVDAVERDVISLDSGQVQFDTAATQSGLIAELIAECEAHPQRTLAQLLQRGRPHLSAFIDELVSDGAWHRHGLALGAAHSEYRDRDAGRFEQLRTQLSGQSAATFVGEAAHNAALVALAGVLNLQPGSHHGLHEPSQKVMDACGPLAWIVTDATTYLLDAQRTDLAAGGLDGTTSAAQLASS